MKGTRVCLMIPNYKVSNNTYRRAVKLGLEVIENGEVLPQLGKLGVIQ